MVKSRVVLLVMISLALSFGCKKKPDLSKYKARAMAMAAKYSPKVAELSKHLPELASHAKDLPVNVPGADKLAKLITENKSSLEDAQKVLADLPNKIANESPEQAQKDLDAADAELAKDVDTAEKDEKEEETIEAAATTPPAPAAGSAAAAGSATPAAGK